MGRLFLPVLPSFLLPILYRQNSISLEGLFLVPAPGKVLIATNYSRHSPNGQYMRENSLSPGDALHIPAIFAILHLAFIGTTTKIHKYTFLGEFSGGIPLTVIIVDTMRYLLKERRNS